MNLLSPNLVAFTTIVSKGTVHGAASELRITQTAVTQRLRSLEQNLGTTLFLRSRKGMTLTSDGQALLRYCLGAKDLEGIVLSQINGAAINTPAYVTIAGPTSIMTSRIAEQCLPLYQSWPSMYLNFVIDDSIDRINMVRTGAASLAIVSPETVPNEMESKKLKPDKYILVATCKWKGRRLTDILETERVIDFDEGDLTTVNYLKKSDLIQGLKRPRLFLNNNEVLINYFKLGIGFGTLTQEIAKPHLDNGDLIALNGGMTMEDPQALVWYPRPVMPPYFLSILKAIK